MKIETKALGSVEVSEKQKITFSEGLLGFEFIHDYFLLDMEGMGPLYMLQAAEAVDICFILIDPRVFIPDYRLIVPQSDLEVLEIRNDDERIDFAIVTIPENPEEMTANLLGPILINRHSRQARQVISLNEAYSTRHLILPALGGGPGGGS